MLLNALPVPKKQGYCSYPKGFSACQNILFLIVLFQRAGQYLCLARFATGLRGMPVGAKFVWLSHPVSQIFVRLAP